MEEVPGRGATYKYMCLVVRAPCFRSVHAGWPGCETGPGSVAGQRCWAALLGSAVSRLQKLEGESPA